MFYNISRAYDWSDLILPVFKTAFPRRGWFFRKILQLFYLYIKTKCLRLFFSNFELIFRSDEVAINRNDIRNGHSL